MRNGDYDLIIAPSWYPGLRYRGRYCYLHIFTYWFYYRVLPKHGEQIHHKNENKRDNLIGNLELLSGVAHRKMHSRGLTYAQVVCPSSNAVFLREKRRVHAKKLLFCSRKCIGRYKFATKFRKGEVAPKQQLLIISRKESLHVHQALRVDNAVLKVLRTEGINI